jgi:hypothetical protein
MRIPKKSPHFGIETLALREWRPLEATPVLSRVTRTFFVIYCRESAPDPESTLPAVLASNIKRSTSLQNSPACKDTSAQILLEPRAKGSAMRGLARRLAVQTLSQLLTFGLCASSTESVMQKQPQRPAPGARTNTSPVDNCRSLHCYLGKSYLDLFELSPHLEFSASKIAAEKQALEEGRKSCAGEFKAHQGSHARCRVLNPFRLFYFQLLALGVFSAVTCEPRGTPSEPRTTSPRKPEFRVS